jgi:PleD family two-component response regulator
LAEVSERMVVAVPSIRPLPDEITAFVRLADQALYASKRGGRNQVTAYVPEFGSQG